MTTAVAPAAAAPVVVAAVVVLVGVAPWTGLVGSAAAVAPAGPASTASLGAGSATTPTASCALSRDRIEAGESVTLDASASTNATAYRYDRFGDGNFGEWVDSETRTFVYDEPGTYEPRVQVRSPDDATDTASCGTLTVESANEPPTADFSYSPTAPDPGESVSFTAEASDPDGEVVAYEWRVDGEPVADGPTLEYTFEERGDHVVELTVTDDDDATDTASRTVTVSENRPPTADFSYSPTEPSPGETVSFTAEASDSDGEVVAYEWRIDGQPAGDRPTLDHTFEEGGDHVVELTVTDDDGATDTVSRTVTVASVNEPPVANVTYAPAEPTPGETVSFTAEASDPDGEVVAYEWRVDGEVVGDGPALEYAFPGPGEYEVDVEVTDDGGATGTGTVFVTVGETNLPPTVEFDYTPAEPTAGETVNFEAGAADEDGEVVAYEWRVDGEVVGEGPTLEYTFEEPGEYPVAVRATDDDGNTTARERTVVVGEAATPTPTSAPRTPTGPVSLTAAWWHSPLRPTAGETTTLVARGPADPRVTYRWDVDADGEFERTGPTASVAFPGPGEYTVTLRAVGPDGEAVTSGATVRVTERRDRTDAADGPTFWTRPVDPVPGETVTLVADPVASPDGVDSYRWDLDGDGDSEAEGRVVTVTFPEAGSRTVTLRTVGADGSTETSTRSVSTRQRPPGSNASGDDGPSLWMRPLDPQAGQTVTLVADPATAPESVEAYRWDVDGDGEPEAEGRSVTYAYPGGRFAVGLTIERANGSAVTVEDSLAVGDPTPTAERTPTPTSDEDEDDEPGDTTTAGSAEPTETTTDGQPGLGVAGGLAALVLAALWLTRRGRR